ncbi:MAG: hypothetical protein ACOCXA_02920 [Planctomycetota bacterium]
MAHHGTEHVPGRGVVLEPTVPRWVLIWMVILAVTCMIGWLNWHTVPEQVLQGRPRKPSLRLLDATSVLHAGDLRLGEAKPWRCLIPVDRAVHVEIDAYTIIGDTLAYGGNLIVDGGRPATVDLEQAFAGRHVIGYWLDGRIRDPDERQLRLEPGIYPVVVIVVPRHNWHGDDLNPYRPGPAWYAQRFAY